MVAPSEQVPHALKALTARGTPAAAVIGRILAADGVDGSLLKVGMAGSR